MKRCTASMGLVLVMALLLGCAAHTHIVGQGAQGGQEVQKRQWYVLFGLVPINSVETDIMAAGASDYTIDTKQSFLDVVINIFTGAVSVYSRTVTVTK